MLTNLSSSLKCHGMTLQRHPDHCVIRYQDKNYNFPVSSYSRNNQPFYYICPEGRFFIPKFTLFKKGYNYYYCTVNGDTGTHFEGKGVALAIPRAQFISKENVLYDIPKDVPYDIFKVLPVTHFCLS